MSGIALIYMRNDVPVEPIILEKMMGALVHRGPDGSHWLIYSPLGIGHQHFWTTPEEVGEQQPLTWEGLTVAFDGRLDNRKELLAALNLDTIDDRQLSDAAIIVRAYRRWGNACFNRLLGPFAIAMYDHQQQTVVCARDPLGDRSLCYYVHRDFVLVASEEQALLTHTAVSDTLDEDMVAHYFDFKVLSDGSTMFADIKEIQQGTAITFNREGVTKDQFWDFTPPANIQYATDAEYVAHFLSLFEESVRCRMRSTTPIAVLMSGGMDSTSVAAVAANLTSDPITTVSWVFDELKSVDERVNIDACNVHLQTTPHLITGDDAWPFVDIDTWPVNPNYPDNSLSERLYERAFQTVADQGIRPLLIGLFGDVLYSGAESWLADLLREGRIRNAVANWRTHSRGEDLTFYLTDPALLVLARIVLNRIPGGSRIRSREAQSLLHSWLTPEANKRLRGKEHSSLPLPPSVRRPGQFRNLYDASYARNNIYLTTKALYFGVDIRDPYRDRRLVEFVLAIPAHQFYNGELFDKYITRQAMQNLLPEQVRWCTHSSTFAPLFKRGIAEREVPQVQKTLNKTNALWPKFVNRDLIPLGSVDELQDQLHKISDLELMVVGNCVIFELWRDRLQRRSQIIATEPTSFSTSNLFQFEENNHDR